MNGQKYTRCQGVLEHGLNLHRNIPLMCFVDNTLLIPPELFEFWDCWCGDK